MSGEFDFAELEELRVKVAELEKQREAQWVEWLSERADVHIGYGRIIDLEDKVKLLNNIVQTFCISTEAGYELLAKHREICDKEGDG